MLNKLLYGLIVFCLVPLIACNGDNIKSKQSVNSSWPGDIFDSPLPLSPDETPIDRIRAEIDDRFPPKVLTPETCSKCEVVNGVFAKKCRSVISINGIVITSNYVRTCMEKKITR